MSQTPIFGPRRRRLTPLETARLQGFDPEQFSFADQPNSASYKQMGNAVNVGVVRHVFRAFVEQNAHRHRGLWRSGCERSSRAWDMPTRSSARRARTPELLESDMRRLRVAGG